MRAEIRQFFSEKPVLGCVIFGVLLFLVLHFLPTPSYDEYSQNLFLSIPMAIFSMFYLVLLVPGFLIAGFFFMLTGSTVTADQSILICQLCASAFWALVAYGIVNVEILKKPKA